MKYFSVEQLALLSDAVEDLIRLHLGPHGFYVLVVREGQKVNCLSNLPADKSEELRAIFAELAQRPIKSLPHENN